MLQFCNYLATTRHDGVDDAEVEAHADEYADDAFDEDPSEKPGSYADDFFEVEASAG